MPLRIGVTQLPMVAQTKILGLIHRFGSAKHRLQAAHMMPASTTHLIRSTSKRCGGAGNEVTQRLVECVLQPRLIYQAQFQRLTACQWSTLEIINRDAIRGITSLPQHTPSWHLYEYAELNTIEQLATQRREARNLKHATTPLHEQRPRCSPYTLGLPRWQYATITTNKHATVRTRPPGSAQPRVEQVAAPSSDKSTLDVYNDGATYRRGIATAAHCPSQPSIDTSAFYATQLDDPLIMELYPIRDAI
ncbi:hypothetical protein HPB47_026129 [Ixodes persulcatus]|uniref:Uncharacterized protein n=1 Tax=Ixodes persulcatus TaxID=34615 RepID=A0AC60Q212_IXOPE|nr:hypothetical protein HPB47_026129 [Ixodes persulcatus]